MEMFFPILYILPSIKLNNVHNFWSLYEINAQYCEITSSMSSLATTDSDTKFHVENLSDVP